MSGRFVTIYMLILLGPLSTARADSSPEQRAALLSPFINANTLAVARLDPAGIDQATIRQRFEAIARVPADDRARIARLLEDQLAAWTQAGGKDLYLIWGIEDLFHRPYLVIPVGGGLNVDAMTKLLTKGPGQPAKNPTFAAFERAERFGDFLVAGSDAQLKRLRAAPKSARPELVEAFGALADTSTVQLALIPPARFRQVLGEVFHKLPEEWGGGSGKALSDGLIWAAFGLDWKPGGNLSATVRSQDPTATQSLGRIITTGLQNLAKNDLLERNIPNFAKLSAALEFKANGDRLTLANTDQAQTIATLTDAAVLSLHQLQGGVLAGKLKQIAIAFHVYHDAKGRFPPQAALDKDGKPLLSWRVLILPDIGEEKLYREFRLDEPWDSEHNKKLISRMPKVYRGIRETTADAGKTIFLVPKGVNTAFPGDKQVIKIPNDFPDGTSNTIVAVAVEDRRAIPWTKPEDLPIDPKNPPEKLGDDLLGGYWVAFADGSSYFVSNTLDPKQAVYNFIRNSGQRKER